jgi:hypothetical protein
MNTKPCEHEWVTSTFELGPHCATCNEPLVSLFHTISRNTLAGALLYAMRHPERVGEHYQKIPTQ